MQLEILALRHQLTVYQRSGVRARLKPSDRIFWAWLSRVWSGWQNALVFAQPATVIAWQRKRFRDRVRGMGLQEVITAPRSPWQNAHAERLIGSIRRECLDHAIVLSENHLRRALRSYFSYYHRWRTHLSLEMDCPQPRRVQSFEAGEVTEVPEIGGLHHHYERRAA